MASYGDMSFVTKASKNTIKGLEWPCRNTNTGGMVSRNYNLVSIKQGLIQLILTQRGERPMRLDFGTDVRRSVFDPLDATTLSNLRTTIAAAIEKYEPRVIMQHLGVSASDDESRVDIKLVFSVKEDVLSTESIELTVNANGAILYG